MGVRMIDLLDMTRDLEAKWLADHAKTAKKALDTAKEDGVTPAGLEQMEAMLLAIRNEGIGRIRSSTLLMMVKHGSLNG